MLNHLQKSVSARVCESIGRRTKGSNQRSKSTHSSNKNILRGLGQFFDDLGIVFEDFIDQHFCGVHLTGLS
jgi:hypothetical protein